MQLLATAIGDNGFQGVALVWTGLNLPVLCIYFSCVIVLVYVDEYNAFYYSSFTEFNDA